jgi:HSP20 family molecular chaperone IbpA
MSLLFWQSLQALETIHQQIYASLTSLIESNCRSTVWLNTDGSDLISQIKIHETDTDMVLDIQLLEQLTNLEIQISSETAVIRARLLEDEVEGFFSSGQRQNIIPLPIAVHPEAVRAELHQTVLTLTLPKAGEIDRQCIALQVDDKLLPHPQSSGLVPRSMASL